MLPGVSFSGGAGALSYFRGFCSCCLTSPRSSNHPQVAPCPALVLFHRCPSPEPLSCPKSWTSPAWVTVGGEVGNVKLCGAADALMWGWAHRMGVWARGQAARWHADLSEGEKPCPLAPAPCMAALAGRTSKHPDQGMGSSWPRDPQAGPPLLLAEWERVSRACSPGPEFECRCMPEPLPGLFIGKGKGELPRLQGWQ